MKALLVLALLFVNEASSTSPPTESTEAPTTNGAQPSTSPIEVGTTNGAQPTISPIAVNTTTPVQGNGTSTEGSGSASVQLWMPSLVLVLLISKFSVLVTCSYD